MIYGFEIALPKIQKYLLAKSRVPRTLATVYENRTYQRKETPQPLTALSHTDFIFNSLIKYGVSKISSNLIENLISELNNE